MPIKMHNLELRCITVVRTLYFSLYLKYIAQNMSLEELYSVLKGLKNVEYTKLQYKMKYETV